MSPAASSSKSSTSSGRFANEQETPNNSVSPARENFPYVPQVFKSPKKTDHIPPLMQNYHPPPLIINTSVPPPCPIIPKMISSSIEVNLCPEIPIFGKFNFKKGFVFDESLHNLLPSSRDKVPINESDIVILNDVINDGNAAGFLQLLDQYKSPSTLQHFITMCIAHLKNTAGRPYNQFIDLIENVENVCPNFKTDPFLKGVFEVIVFNLLFFLERKGHWTDTRKLIELFCDWDNLITSKLLQHFATQKLTPIGRYIFLARLLAEANAFYKVYDILQSPDLRLLLSPDRWPLFHATPTDIEQRNALLTTFFKFAYRHNIEVTCDMYRNIFQFGNIWEFDAFSFFNPMLELMINNERTSLLKHFYTYIDVFYKHMTKNVFRGFLIHLDRQLVLENKFKLYEMGSQKGIYVCFTGRETTILVRTNMLDVELKLILQYFMHKLALVPQEMFNNIRIEIKLPAEIAKSPKILQNCLRSIVQVNSSVKKLLYECFGIWKNFENDLNSTVVEVSKEELKSVFS